MKPAPRPPRFFFSPFLSFFILILASCGSASSPAAAPTAALPASLEPSLAFQTPEPTPTAKPTRTRASLTFTPAPAQTPTITPLPPYPTRPVLLDYTVSGMHTPYDLFFSDFKWSELVVYTDGQIILPGHPYRQKILSKAETDRLLSQLESLGFYAIESNQRHDPSDKLYNFGGRYRRISDGLWHCVLVNGERPRDLCAYDPFRDYWVPRMKNIVAFLDAYRPAGLTPYSPDRIFLWVQAGRNPYDSDLPKDSIPWTEPALSLETSSEEILYAEGEMAGRLFAQFGEDGVVVTQNDVEYTVYIQIVLPHEEISNLLLQ